MTNPGGTTRWLAEDENGNTVTIVHYNESGHDDLFVNEHDGGVIGYPLTPGGARDIAAKLIAWADEREAS